MNTAYLILFNPILIYLKAMINLKTFQFQCLTQHTYTHAFHDENMKLVDGGFEHILRWNEDNLDQLTHIHLISPRNDRE